MTVTKSHCPDRLLGQSRVCLDGELMPWSLKAEGLLRQQYAPVGAAGQAALTPATAALRQAADRGLAVEELARRYQERAAVDAYTAAYRPYVWSVASVDDLRVAPFQILATAGAVPVDKTHVWHLETLDSIVAASPSPCLRRTAFRLVDLADAPSEAAAVAWWRELTAQGARGWSSNRSTASPRAGGGGRSPPSNAAGARTCG